MPKKKAKKRTTTRRKTTRKRRNPTTTRRSTGFLGPVEGAVKKTIPALGGAMAAKLIQRRWGGGSSETQNWDWKDYLFAALGTLGAALGSKFLFRSTKATQEQIMAGGLTLIGFKLITNEIAPMSATLETWLGEDGNMYNEGDRYMTESGESYVLGQNGEWLPEGIYPRMTGDVVQSPSRLGAVDTRPPYPPQKQAMGDIVEAPGSLGDHWGNVWDPVPQEGPVW